MKRSAIQHPKTLLRASRLKYCLVLPFLLCGCSHTHRPKSVVVPVFDMSASTNSAPVQQLYRQSFTTLVAAFTGGNILQGYAVTGNTQSTSLTRIQQNFPAYNPMEDNQDQFQAKLAKAKEEALQQFKAFPMNVSRSSATDLLHAFNDAANIFASEPDASDRRLIVFSDMLQQAGGVDFLVEDLTEARDTQIIEGLRQTGQLPSLTGVSVDIVGAAADPKGRIPPEKIAHVRRFWLAYFKACGADLRPEHYGMVLTPDATSNL